MAGGNFLGRLDRRLERLYVAGGYVGGVFLVLLALLIIASIVSRLIGVFIPGLNVYAGYSMAASSFFALAYTFRSGGHIRVAILRTAMKGRARAWLELWCLSIAAFFTVFLAYYLTRMTYISWVFGERSEGADATLLWIPQTGMALGSIVLAVCVVHTLIRHVIGFGDEQPPEPSVHESRGS